MSIQVLQPTLLRGGHGSECKCANCDQSWVFGNEEERKRYTFYILIEGNAFRRGMHLVFEDMDDTCIDAETLYHLLEKDKEYFINDILFHGTNRVNGYVNKSVQLKFHPLWEDEDYCRRALEINPNCKEYIDAAKKYHRIRDAQKAWTDVYDKTWDETEDHDKAEAAANKAVPNVDRTENYVC